LALRCSSGVPSFNQSPFSPYFTLWIFIASRGVLIAAFRRCACAFGAGLVLTVFAWRLFCALTLRGNILKHWGALVRIFIADSFAHSRLRRRWTFLIYQTPVSRRFAIGGAAVQHSHSLGFTGFVADRCLFLRVPAGLLLNFTHYRQHVVPLPPFTPCCHPHLLSYATVIVSYSACVGVCAFTCLSSCVCEPRPVNLRILLVYSPHRTFLSRTRFHSFAGSDGMFGLRLFCGAPPALRRDICRVVHCLVRWFSFASRYLHQGCHFASFAGVALAERLLALTIPRAAFELALLSRLSPAPLLVSLLTVHYNVCCFLTAPVISVSCRSCQPSVCVLFCVSPPCIVYRVFNLRFACGVCLLRDGKDILAGRHLPAVLRCFRTLAFCKKKKFIRLLFSYTCTLSFSSCYSLPAVRSPACDCYF